MMLMVTRQSGGISSASGPGPCGTFGTKGPGEGKGGGGCCCLLWAWLCPVGGSLQPLLENWSPDAEPRLP